MCFASRPAPRLADGRVRFVDAGYGVARLLSRVEARKAAGAAVLVAQGAV